MAPLGLGGGFYGLGPTINAGEAVHVNDEDGNYLVVPTGSLGAEAANGVVVSNGFQSTLRGSFTFSTYFYLGNEQDTTKSRAYLFSTQKNNQNNFQIVVLSPFQVLIIHEANNDQSLPITGSNAAGLDATATGWHHMLCTVTKNSSANTSYKLYIDGSEISLTNEAAISDTNHALYEEDDEILIGNRYDKDGNRRAWLLKHTALWSVALDANNIAEIYGAGINTPLDLTSASGDYDQQGNLVGYWKFTDGSGTTAVDTTGNNNGTVTGNATLI